MKTAIGQWTPEQAARRPIVTSRGRRELAAQPLLSALRRDGAGRVPTFGEMSTGDILTLQRIAGNAVVAGLARGSLAAHSCYMGAAAGRGTGACARRLDGWALEGPDAGVIRRQPVESPSGGGSGSGGCAVQNSGADPRFIADDLCLLSTDLKGDSRLNDAFHNNPPLTAKDNTPKDPTGPVGKFQKALIVVGENLGKDGADGEWGSKTTQAVASFQSKNGIQPGGFEAGRKTLLALDAQLQQRPPKPPPPPPPPQNVTVTTQCGTAQQAGTVVVTGTGFPPGRVDLTFDGTGGNSTLADATGFFSGGVPPNLKDGPHVVEAASGSVHGAAQFTTPCGASPGPTPAPGSEELETVLNRISIAYQLLLTRERDGALALCRDLSSLDVPHAPATVKLLVDILIGLVSFEYGFAEGAILQTIKNGLKDRLKGHEERIEDINQGTDQVVSAILQAGQEEIAKVGNRNIKDRSDLLAGFCDNQLDEVTREGFAALDKFEVDFKPRLRRPAAAGGKRDARNQSGDPRVDVGLAKLDAVNETAAAAFQIHYDTALRQWDSKLAQSRLGVDEGNIKDTNLEPLKGSASIPPGVLDVHLELALDGSGEEVVGARIDGLSERVRTVLKGKTGADLHLPIVAEGFTATRRMRIGITESHENIVDLTTSNSGGQWLTLRGNGDRRQGVLRVADTVLKARMPDIEAG